MRNTLIFLKTKVYCINFYYNYKNKKKILLNVIKKYIKKIETCLMYINLVATFFPERTFPGISVQSQNKKGCN